MTPRRVLEVSLTVFLLVVAGSLVAGQLLGQPVLLSFVETGSMAPTLQPGDGFIAIPPAFAGPIQKGDVITFDAEELNGGGLVTHRVVGETKSGYITKGDANPFTDQDGQEPPVTPAQIKAVALQVNGNVVVIPHLGSAVLAIQGIIEGTQRRLAAVLGTRQMLGTQGFAYILLAVGVLTYLGSAILERRQDGQRQRQRPQPRRPVYDTRKIIAVLTIGVIVLTSSAMIAPSGPRTIDIVSTTSDSPRRGVIPTGATENVTFTIQNNGYLPAVGFFEPRSQALALTQSEVFIRPGGSVNVSVAVTAPPETGAYRYTMVNHWYLAVLPRGTIRALYTLHPWAPILVIDTILAAGFAALAIGVVGFGRYRVRKSGPSAVERLREQVKEWSE